MRGACEVVLPHSNKREAGHIAILLSVSPGQRPTRLPAFIALRGSRPGTPPP